MATLSSRWRLRTPRAAIWPLKLGLTLALLFVVSRRLDAGELLRLLGGVSAPALGAALALTALTAFVNAVRWRRVLAHLGERVPVRALLGDVLVGTAYNWVLPTSIGGDVARAIRCKGRLVEGAHAWSSVLFERLIGLVSLALFACFGLVAHGRLEGRPWMVPALATLAIALALGFSHLPLRWAGRFGTTFATMAEAFSGPLRRFGCRIEIFGWSLVSQIASLTILFCVSTSQNLPVMAEAIYLGVPIILIASIAPVTIGGFGLREGLFVWVLGRFDVAKEEALMLSFVWLSSSIVTALAGLVVLLAERRRG